MSQQLRDNMQELEGVLEARKSDFDVESFAKVIWMMGRAHHTSAATCALVDTLADRALHEQATPQVPFPCLTVLVASLFCFSVRAVLCERICLA
jgi:hypothetical protein